MKNSTALILLLISVALVYTVGFPYYDKIMILRTQSAQYKNSLDQVDILIKKRNDLEAKYQNMPQNEIAKLEKVLPDNVDTVNLAVNFDSIAAKYGISIKKISTVDQVDQSGAAIVQDSSGGSYKPVTVIFSFTAPYEDFRDFIGDIEQSLRITDIKSVSFESNDDGLYEYSLAVQTYWLKTE
ncbi:MAG TPA: type 4a pilus biogenesis protein PilO [Parcubacteria group bacterium]|nr:type 4a pilus biogenesis protein PilO [Parcubacteria group bacterium]